MKFVIQRTTEASVSVEGTIVGKIGKGYVVLVGVAQNDTEQLAEKMVRKMIGLRIFEDEDGKTNKSLADVNGELLMVSQFTLLADCHKGNRPSFIHAGDPQFANDMYEYILDVCRRSVSVVEKGIFGADMKVTLVNDGPFTIILDSEEMFGE